MATKTLGTGATNSLTALLFNVGSMSDTDIATLQQSILDDQNVAHPVYPGAFSKNGLLYIPNRGVLRVLPSDYVGVDARGWPILVSNDAITGAGSSWSHS